MSHNEDQYISLPDLPKSFDLNTEKLQNKRGCRSNAINGEKCRYSVENGKNCCRRHAAIENYTDEMFENLKRCEYCPIPRWMYFGDADRCTDCQLKQQQKHEHEHEHEQKQNEHTIYKLILDADVQKKRLCSGFKKSGCHSLLDADYKFSKCKICLEHESKQMCRYSKNTSRIWRMKEKL